MLRLFNDNKPYVLFILPLILAAYYAQHVFLDKTPTDVEISLGLWGSFHPSSRALVGLLILGFFLQLLAAIVINYVFNQANFHERNNYIPSLLYLTLAAAFVDFYSFNGIFLAMMGVLLAFNQLLQLDQNIAGGKSLFNASFLYCLAASIFPPLLLGLPIIYFMGLIFRPFFLRELGSFLLAILLVGFYIFAFRTYVELPGFWEDFWLFFTPKSFSTHQGIFLVFSTVLAVLSFWTLGNKWNSYSNRTRKEIQVLIGSLLVLGSTFIFNISTAAAIALPILVLLGTFSFIHRKFRRISYVLTYAAILFIFTKFLLKV